MRPARVAGGVVKLGSAIGDVCCACAPGPAANSAAQANMMVRLTLLIEAVYLFPLIPAQVGIQQLGPRPRGDEQSSQIYITLRLWPKLPPIRWPGGQPRRRHWPNSKSWPARCLPACRSAFATSPPTSLFG